MTGLGDPSDWKPVESVNLDVVNADLVAGSPTADVAIHYPANLDEPHHEESRWPRSPHR